MAVFLAVLITSLICAVISLFVKLLRTRADYDDLWRDLAETRERLRRAEKVNSTHGKQWDIIYEAWKLERDRLLLAATKDPELILEVHRQLPSN